MATRCSFDSINVSKFTLNECNAILDLCERCLHQSFCQKVAELNDRVKEIENKTVKVTKVNFKNLRMSTQGKNGKPYSCRKLAEEMGDIGYYSKINQIENGEKEPSLRDYRRYMKYFDVTFEFLDEDG